MKVMGKSYRTIWLDQSNPKEVKIINQLKLPFSFEIISLRSCKDACFAISEMQVRGAGLIGATAGFGMYLATLECSDHNFQEDLENFAKELIATRPTASNLFWAINRQKKAIEKGSSPEEKRLIAKEEAITIADEDANFCRKIGEYGLKLIEEISKSKNGNTVNILTHCNAGWLAFVDYGSATSPIYAAHDAGLDVHVWVDETRPRNQGASLTCWEFAQHGIKHTLIVDNLGGHLMQHGMVDMVLVGTDRTARNGDVANKIGTYLKALAAKDNEIPFYVALPSSTFDFEVSDGIGEIPIEERSQEEVLFLCGLSSKKQEIETIQIAPSKTKARNWGFDVTPAKLISGLISERGICEANEKSILTLFPERA